MKIEFLEKSFLPFENLGIGDVFCHKGCVYMKTNASDVLSANVAIDLHDGLTKFFEPNDMVKKFDDVKVCLR